MDLVKNQQSQELVYYIDADKIKVEVTGESSWGEEQKSLSQIDKDPIFLSSFSERGYQVADFLAEEQNQILREYVRKNVYELINRYTNFSVTYEKFFLEDYHKYVGDDLHLKVVDNFKKGIEVHKFGLDVGIIEKRISEIVGIELECFRNPNLEMKKIFLIRIVRPQKPENNPPHKDVWLDMFRGCVNAYFPVAGSNEKSSLSLLPESHLWSESEIKRTSNGAKINSLNFIVPAVVDCKFPLRLTRPNPAINQVMVFSPYLIHGGAFNFHDSQTRVSFEMRFQKTDSNLAKYH